jgi:predicted ATPase
MRITKVNIPKSFEDNGIEDIKMDKRPLGKIVLIAGKNGSGKTRLLKKISIALAIKLNKASMEKVMQTVKYHENQILNFNEFLEEAKGRLFHNPNNIELQSNVDEIKERITTHQKELDSINQRLPEWNQIETSELAEHYAFVDFVPKRLELRDCANMGKIDLKARATNVSGGGFDSLPEGTFAKIQDVQDRWFNATHQNSQVIEREKEQAIRDYEKLKELVGIFLNTSIGRDLDGNATLFRFAMGQTNLSDGQKVLLQFCVAIYSQHSSLNDLILIMDEPENHLHPSVIVETIDRISEYVTNGQIWIATHSVPLLAHFGSNSIWYMEEGTVSYAGNIPEKVLESLLGDEHEIAKLQDFIGLPAQLAINRFAYECLFEPQAVITGKDDPQVLQIKNELGRFEKEGKIKILDFGAGKGRLLANIVEDLRDNFQSFTDKFDYIAFDKFDNDKEVCEKLLEKVYGSSENKYFNDYKNLLSEHDKASFDIMIMSNVLHEIEPKDWLTLFSENGHITSLLSENGILILVEDTQVPVGEKAYQNGFIVLDTPELKELFNMKQDEFVFNDARNDGRLKCHVIPKECLARINEESRKSALKSLKKTAEDEIIKYRKAEKNYKNGRLHGYYVQQLANTTLALSELTTE